MRKINEHFTDLNLMKVLLVPIKGELESIPSTAGPFDFSMRLGDETIFIGIRCYRSTESVAEAGCSVTSPVADWPLAMTMYGG